MTRKSVFGLAQSLIIAHFIIFVNEVKEMSAKMVSILRETEGRRGGLGAEGEQGEEREEERWREGEG